MLNRWKIANTIAQLDPQNDCQKIAYLISVYEEPWIIRKALEFALFRTYAVPSISRLLSATQQFERYGQKRYDDTALMISLLAEKGYDSDIGRQVIARMNALHGRFRISNEDFLYVLSAFTFEPLRWRERFGWRKPTENEKLAAYYFWVEVGTRMNIKDIPASYEAFERFNIEYEQQHHIYAPTNYKVGRATVEVFASWYPKPVRFLVRRGVYAMLDTPQRTAFGFPTPPPGTRLLAEKGLKLRGALLRWMTPRKKPYFFSEINNRTYPQGFEIDQLGPDPAKNMPIEEEYLA